jgi:hypothetical protein
LTARESRPGSHQPFSAKSESNENDNEIELRESGFRLKADLNLIFQEHRIGAP